MQPNARTPARPVIEERDPEGHVEARTPATPPTPQDAALAGVPANKPNHPPGILFEARQLGFNQEEIDLLTPAELAREVRSEKFRREQRAAARQPEPPRPAEEEDKIDWGKADDGTPYTEASYPAPVARAIKAQHAAEKRAKAHEEEIANLKNQLNQASQQRTAEQIGGFFAKYPKLYGAEPLSAAPGSPEHARQAAVLAMIKGFQAKTTLLGDLAKAHGLLFGQPAATPAPETPPVDDRPDPADVVQRAVERTRQPQPRDPETGKFTPQQFEEGATLPPTQRQIEEPKGRSRAIKEVAALQRARGHYVPSFNGDDDLGVPE